MSCPFGDGSELDAFDDLPISLMADAEFIEQPKTAPKVPKWQYNDRTELDDFDDLPVSLVAEARFLKQPVSVTTRKFENTIVIIRKPLKVLPSIAPEPEERHPGLLSLPRELRDEVYSYLLCNNYRVKLPLARSRDTRKLYCMNSELNKAFRAPFFPRFRRPQHQQNSAQHASQPTQPGSQSAQHGLQSAPSLDIAAPWHSDSHKYKESDAVLMSTWNFAIASKCLPILLASKATYEEAADSVYSRSTFFFFINRPRLISFGASTSLKRMNNVYIHVDLLRAYMRRCKTADQSCTLEFCRSLIQAIGNIKDERTSCIISFVSSVDTSFLLQSSMLQAFKALTGFKTVALRITRTHRGWDPPSRAYATWIRELRKGDLCLFFWLNDFLKPELGPGKAFYGPGDFHCLVFHPRAYLTGSKPPEFNVDDLINSLDRIFHENPCKS